MDWVALVIPIIILCSLASNSGKTPRGAKPPKEPGVGGAKRPPDPAQSQDEDMASV